MSDAWLPRDLDIIRVLTRCVTMMALCQIARIWWPESTTVRAARQRLRRLVRRGLLLGDWINAHPLLPADRPLAVWHPGEEDPDFERLADVARRRWSQPAQPTPVYAASHAAAALLGSTARGLPAAEHRDHDLRLAEVYVRYRLRHPRQAALWIGEHALPKAGYQIKDPDAFLIGPSGQVTRVIETAGRYRPEQLERFHEHCRECGLPYELW
jgi:hypothetical protein